MDAHERISGLRHGLLLEYLTPSTCTPSLPKEHTPTPGETAQVLCNYHIKFKVQGLWVMHSSLWQVKMWYAIVWWPINKQINKNPASNTLETLWQKQNRTATIKHCIWKWEEWQTIPPVQAVIKSSWAEPKRYPALAVK